MKTIYKISIFAVLFLFVTLSIFILFTPLGSHDKYKTLIQTATGFIALGAAIVALSSSDKEIKAISANILFDHFDNESLILQRDIQPRLIDFEHPGTPIITFKVHFKLKNTTGFSLIKPFFTFKIPKDKRHPIKMSHISEMYDNLGFNSNLLNVQKDDLRLIDIGEHIVFSNNILPYWNNNDEISIWIRMAEQVTIESSNGSFESKSGNPFDVEVSINCDNADGITKIIRIDPSQVFNNSSKNQAQILKSTINDAI
jgi:hypothetical protein